MDVENDEKIEKHKSLLESMRGSPLGEVSHSQTTSTNTNKRQFDVASLLGHHNQRSKDPVVAAAAAAISSALTQRFSEAKEQASLSANTRFEENIKHDKMSRREIVEDEEDFDGNNSDNSIDDSCNFPKLPRLQNYKDGSAAPGIGHRSFFSPIRETQNTPSSEVDIPTEKSLIENNIIKNSPEETNIDTRTNKEDNHSGDEERSFEDETTQSHNRLSERLNTQESCKDTSRALPMKCATGDDASSKDRDMDTLRSPFSFMQAASAQSFNNNLLHQESQTSSLNPTGIQPHEYLARYYQIMQQHQQQAAAAGMNGATPLSSRHHH